MRHIKRSERSIRRGNISWEQSQEDLNIAQSCIKSYPEKSCLQSSQSAINALSSVLETEGNFQLPAFSSLTVLDASLSIAPELDKLRSHCQVLDSTLARDLLGNTVQKNIRFTSAFARSCFHAGKAVQKGVQAFRKTQANT